jgi:hypothetical protein
MSPAETALLIHTVAGALRLVSSPGEQSQYSDRQSGTGKSGGQRVRLVAPPTVARPLSGQLWYADDDSLVILSSERTVSVHWADLTRLERSRGVRSYTLLGALTGFGLGLAVPLIVFSASETDCSFGACHLIAGGAAVAGLLLGTTVGSHIHSERWTKVSLRTGWAWSGGAGLGVRIYW